LNQLQLVVVHAPMCSFGTAEEAPLRVSLDWWAVIAAAVAVCLIKAGVVPSIPW